MDAKNKQPKTLQKAIQYFSDEQICIDTVAAIRWPDGPTCPACEKKDHYYLKTQRRWKCKECGRQFSVKLGTIFEDSPLSLDKWLCALWMLVNCKNGVSSYEIGRDLGVTQKSAWFMLQRLRLALQSGSLEKIGGPGSEVECDETFIGGSLKFMHAKRRALWRDQRGPVGKAIVMGILDRSKKKVHTKIVPNRTSKVLQGEIKERVHAGTSVYTDDAVPYFKMDEAFVHEVCNHVDQYVNGRVHTNGLENFWCLLKRSVKGTYVGVEPFHLSRYLDEQVFRYNNRATKEKPMNDGDRFELALSQIAGKRLTYAEVTGKVEQAAF